MPEKLRSSGHPFREADRRGGESAGSDRHPPTSVQAFQGLWGGRATCCPAHDMNAFSGHGVGLDKKQEWSQNETPCPLSSNVAPPPNAGNGTNKDSGQPHDRQFQA